MARGHPLRMGSRISSVTGVASGRIGAFARGAGGRIYALVARHVAFAEGDGRVFEHDEELGAAETWRCADTGQQERLPISQTIAAIDVTDACRPIVVEEAGISVTAAYDDPLDTLDLRVRTLADSDSFASGTVAWVGSNVRIRFHDGTEAQYSGAVEVSLDEMEEGGLCRGDAGMPIIDDDGGLVGLVISGTHSRCFVAPVAPFLRQHNLTLYRLSEPSTASKSQVDQVAAGLRDVSSNLTEWMQENQRRTPLFLRSADGEARLVLEGVE